MGHRGNAGDGHMARGLREAVMDAPHTISSLETLDWKMITGLMKKKKSQQMQNSKKTEDGGRGYLKSNLN